jgi:hypothetical protein
MEGLAHLVAESLVRHGFEPPNANALLPPDAR